MYQVFKEKPNLDNESSIIKKGYYLTYINMMVFLFAAIIYIVLYFMGIANTSNSGSPDSGDVAGWGIILFPIFLGIIGCTWLPDYLNYRFFDKYIYSKANKWLKYIIVSSLIGCLINFALIRDIIPGVLGIIVIAIYILFKIAIIVYSIVATK